MASTDWVGQPGTVSGECARSRYRSRERGPN